MKPFCRNMECPILLQVTIIKWKRHQTWFTLGLFKKYLYLHRCKQFHWKFLLEINYSCGCWDKQKTNVCSEKKEGLFQCVPRIFLPSCDILFREQLIASLFYKKKNVPTNKVKTTIACVQNKTWPKSHKSDSRSKYKQKWRNLEKKIIQSEVREADKINAWISLC